MSKIPGLRRVFRLTFGRTGATKDIDEEIRFHLESRVEDLKRAGKTQREAEALARAEFGDVERFRTQLLQLGRRKVRRERRTEFLGTVRQDVSFSIRQLLRYKSFSAVAVLTLALGLGATTAVFSVVNGVLLRPLPYPTADRLVMVWGENPVQGWTRSSMSNPDISDVRGLAGADFVEGFVPTTFTLATEGRPVVVEGSFVTGGLLEGFGFAPEVGRDIRQEENHPSSAPVVVLGHSLWANQYGEDPGIIGTMIQIGDERHEVVGIAPPEFDFPQGAQLWVPHRHACFAHRGCRNLAAVARLAPQTDLEAAQGALTALAASLREEYPDFNAQVEFRYEPLLDSLVGDVRAGLWVLLGAVGLMLLVVSANLANLLLARASGRREEVAVRTALGASRWRLVSQLLVESLVLAGVGCATGLALAWGMVRGFATAVTETFPRAAEVSLDGTVLFFALGVAGMVAVLFGLSPALHLARQSVAEALRAGLRGQTTTRENRARSWLLSAQICLSVVLLTGTGLLLRSLGELYQVDLGFQHQDVLRFRLSLPPGDFSDPQSLMSLIQEVEATLEAEPVVTSIGSVVGPPLGSGVSSGDVVVEGRPEPEPDDVKFASVHAATPGYFETLGLSILRGRGLQVEDRADGPQVAVVSEEFARENFPGEDAMNQQIRVAVSTGAGKAFTIVGVVRDTRRSLTGDPRSQVYVPLAQAHSPIEFVWPGLVRELMTTTIHVRSANSGSTLLPLIQQRIESVDPRIAVTGVETVTGAIRRYAAPTRHQFQLMGLFALLAAILAGVGLYGVVSFLVAQREREIGIRRALGADGKKILGMVLRKGVVPVGVGVVAGIAAALTSGRLVDSLLYQVEPTDPGVMGCVVLLVLLLSLLAILLPARNAARVNPAASLRME